MILAQEFVDWLGRQIVRRLPGPGFEVLDLHAGAILLADTMLDSLEEEDRIADEVRDLLEKHGETMRTQGISYQEMFRKAKNTMMAQRKIVRAAAESGDKMKVSRDKVNDLSHKMIDAMRKSKTFRVKREWNDVRLGIAKHLTELLEKEHLVEQAARKKITSQKKDILEGTQEWEILHRRYYAEELKNYGIDLKA
jgi:hypothetical protein